MGYRCLLLVMILASLGSCSNLEDEQTDLPIEGMYFPPIGTDEWETTSVSSLEWDLDKIEELKEFMIEENSKSLMILINGRIVLEEYFNGHNAQKTWEWNSAGKTLVTATTGIAEQEGIININNKVSDYLGADWTSEPIAKEELIRPHHLLAMTSGIDDEKNLIIHSNLTYVSDAGTRWAYSNVFQKLIDVISESSNQDFKTYFKTNLEDKIGMKGFWDYGLIFKIYHSDTRSMARYGLLSLNKGKWKEEQIVNKDFFDKSISSSQNLNPSYGYMWWLNGKTSYMLPESQVVFEGSLIPNAPDDMYAALGAAEQRMYIVPNKNMVVIRMGEAANVGNSEYALSGFDNALWEKLNAVFNE